jgi:outer membrane receptor protein involved in Fe transport
MYPTDRQKGSLWFLLYSGVLVAVLFVFFSQQTFARQASADNEKPKQAEKEATDSKETDLRDEPAKDLPVVDFDNLYLPGILGEDFAETAGKRDQRASRSLSSVSVITREDIESMPYQYLGDILATIPGLDVRWGQMQRYYVGARGLGGTALNSRMLLLLDGQPMNMPLTGELNAGHFVPLSDIDRIEVIRGPGSSLYGANAYAGVVNLVTKSRKGMSTWEGLQATGLFGSFLTRRIQASYGQPVGPVDLSASVEVSGTEGSFPEQEVLRPEGSQIFKNDDAKVAEVSLHAAWKNLRVSGRYLEGERGRPGQFRTDDSGNIMSCSKCHTPASALGNGIKYPSTSTSCGSCHLQPRDREYIRRGSVSLDFKHDFTDEMQVSANAFHNEWSTHYHTIKSTEFLEEAPGTDLDLKQRRSGAEVRLQHKAGQLNTLIGGVGLNRSEVASQLLLTPEGDNRAVDNDLSVFVEDELTPLDWLAVTLGGRYDYSSLHGHALAPRGGVVIKPDDQSAVRLSAARAFRNPSFSELFLVDSRGKYQVCGNPDLSPEWISSFEAAASYEFSKPLLIELTASAFYNLADDLISFRTINDSKASFFNIDSAKSMGLEAQLKVEKGPEPRIKGYLNYSYTWTEDGNGQQLPYAPQSKINLGMQATLGRFDISVWSRLVGERYDNMGIKLPTFATIDVKAVINFFRQFRLEIWANNLADEIYQESLGIPGARRSFFIVLGYRQR